MEAGVNRTIDETTPAAKAATDEISPPAGDGLLRRWSRRKTQARAEAESPASSGAEETVASAPLIPVNSPVTPSPVLTDADMPPIESLDQDSDYRPFMSSGVSEALRLRALRRMFHSGLFNERCPLDSEYYDCHGYEPLGSVITHEMREEMERAAAAIEEQAKQALLEPGKPALRQTESSSVPPPAPGADKEG
jgi:hypothetical protein